MAVAKDPRKIADKQIRRLSESIPDITEGVNAVTVAPTELAADNLDRALAGFTKAVQSGKMERNLRSVSLADWKGATLAKVGRIPEGVEAARGTIEKFHLQRNDAQVAIDSELSKIPQRTIEDSIRRMTVQVRGMAGFEFDRSR